MTSLPLFGIDDLIPNAGPGDVERAKLLSQYFTPPKLARRIAEWSNLRGLRVLEPAAGGGALRRAALEAGAASVDCVELDPRYVEALALEELGTVRPGSFLDLRPADFDRPWDLNLQNPPYEGGLDGLFLAHGLEFAPRLVGLVRLAALAGKTRGAGLWSHVELTRMVLLAQRPEFEGELAANGAKSDFVVVEISKLATPRAVDELVRWSSVDVEHWAGAWS